MDKPLIAVNNISKTYNGTDYILRDISCTVNAGQTLAVIGPSGCGKSTLLRILAGITEPTSGSYTLADNRIGMAFQYSALLNSYTVSENVALALTHSSLTDDQKEAIVREKLEVLGLDEFYDAKVDRLSGGQQKRVSFARAIANEPHIILYDEPTAGLDPINSTIIETYINNLSEKYKTASIVVTHQHSTIYNVADYIICLNQGGIVWQGTTDMLRSDENPYIRQFIDGKPHGPFTDNVPAISTKK